MGRSAECECYSFVDEYTLSTAKKGTFVKNIYLTETKTTAASETSDSPINEV